MRKVLEIFEHIPYLFQAVSVYWAYSAVTATAVTLLFKWKKARTFLKVEPEFTQQQYFHFFKQHAEKESGVAIKRPR